MAVNHDRWLGRLSTQEELVRGAIIDIGATLVGSGMGVILFKHLKNALQNAETNGETILIILGLIFTIGLFIGSALVFPGHLLTESLNQPRYQSENDVVKLMAELASDRQELENGRSEVDVLWQANASALALVAATFDSKPYHDKDKERTRRELFLKLHQSLIALNQTCSKYYLLANSPSVDDQIDASTISEISAQITQLSTTFWQNLSALYANATPQALAQKMVEVFRKMDPYSLDSLILVAKQQLPNSQPVWSRPRADNRQPTQTLDAHEPATVVQTLAQLTSCLDTNMTRDGHVFVISEIHDAFSTSLVVESLRDRREGQEISQAMFGQLITRGQIDGMTNNVARLTNQSEKLILNSSSPSVVLVVNDPEDTAWIRNMVCRYPRASAWHLVS